MRVLNADELVVVAGGQRMEITSGRDSNIFASSIYNICVGAYTSLGAWFGRTVGAGAGSAFPVFGTVAGGYVGGIVGGGIGGAIGENICPK